MSLIPLAAPLIRLAAVDDGYAQDLHDAVFADRQTLVSGLVEAQVQEADLVELTPTQWQWYASWRQELGGGLDRVVLVHLTDSALTRFARFQVRELVLRDRPTNALAREFAGPAPDRPDAIGLNWLSEQARQAQVDQALELMNDALQCATEASWFLLRQLTSLRNEVGRSVGQQLELFADRREITPQFRARWYGLGKETLGGH
jgi:hypothetical protein